MPKNTIKEIENGSIVVDLKATVGGKNISHFKEPIEVSIPYGGVAKNSENIKAFYLKDDGNIEFVGGNYDSETKIVTFTTAHFSKYFAKECEFDEMYNNCILWSEKTNYKS